MLWLRPVLQVVSLYYLKSLVTLVLVVFGGDSALTVGKVCCK
ncbi:hypothetical protein [Haliscomenobacter hydrossis]|nr:hypothetical protein [Haliscomenobacter hydrossis]